MYNLTLKVKKSRPTIKHPKWYQFFKKAKIVTSYYDGFVRIPLPGSEEQCRAILADPNTRILLEGIYGHIDSLILQDPTIVSDDPIPLRGEGDIVDKDRERLRDRNILK